MKLSHLILFASTSLLANLTNATAPDHTGWYVGGTVGQIDVKAETKLPYNSEPDADAYGLTAFGGVNFNRHYGIEFSIDENGDISDKKQYRVRGEYNAAVSTISATPKLTAQITDVFSLYAKAGVAIIFYMEEYDQTHYGSEDTIYWSGVGATAGAGAQFALTNQLMFRVSIDMITAELEAVTEDEDYFDSVNDEVVDPPDIDIDITRASLGLYYQF